VVKIEELQDAWRRIEDFPPSQASDPIRASSDFRLTVNGVLWVLRSGA
jgi:hypothetical protein